MFQAFFVLGGEVRGRCFRLIRRLPTGTAPIAWSAVRRLAPLSRRRQSAVLAPTQTQTQTTDVTPQQGSSSTRFASTGAAI